MDKEDKMLEDISAYSIVKWSILVKITCANLSKENQELKETLATKPALPDPIVIYADKVTEKHKQATRM